MKLTVASSPHIRGDFRTSRIMLDVVLALLPALCVGFWQFGLRAVGVTAVSIYSAVVFEWLYSLVTKTRNTIIDGSALVTGMLFAMTLPSTVPYWIAAVGSALAIIVAKLLCGLGGSLDVFAGNVERAPKFFREHGLEWFYRLCKEPKRIGRMMKLPKFVFGSIKDRIFKIER